MSKVGNVMGEVAESVVKAGGVVTKRGGEIASDLGRNLGMSSKTCGKLEGKAEDLGKDMYYASGKVGRSVKNVSEGIENGTKKAYHTIKDKISN